MLCIHFCSLYGLEIDHSIINPNMQPYENIYQCQVNYIVHSEHQTYWFGYKVLHKSKSQRYPHIHKRLTDKESQVLFTKLSFKLHFFVLYVCEM